MNKKIIYIVIALIIAIGLFYGGVKYGEGQTTSSQTAQAGAFARGSGTGFAGGARGSRGGANGGFVVGSILSVSDSSITISTQGGGSKIVIVAPSTTVLKSVSGVLSDLVVGANVSVQGSTNSDGSVTAQSVQIRPAGMGSSTPMVGR